MLWLLPVPFLSHHTMPSPPTFLLLFQLILLFSFQTHSQNAHIITSCSADNFTYSNPYASNLQLLLSNLTTSAPNSSTYSSTFTIGTSPNSQIFGLSQCRPDVSPAICVSCLSNAASTAIGNSSTGCGKCKSAALRFEHCFLRYSDRRFFGIADDSVYISLYNLKNASDPAAFDSRRNSLMREVSHKAASAASRFAVGMKKAGDSYNVYGLAWCTTDLFTSDCAKCLYSAGSFLVKQKIGGMVGFPSCLVRFEVYVFFSLDLLFDIPSPPVRPAVAETPTVTNLALGNGVDSTGRKEKY
ncbi:cysteine-rich repeat secretory protein 38-like [Phalaenopsis equestris]|uniref:cysteine-rich repeat secretory protein 38-like n=1 Tax=Phalaenopsis equestris TaxID=78828 RepID=UPI0009E2F935|nr:cysteine-rich repeat secretory protein 38-like [Phalaenopsis equestris]